MGSQACVRHLCLTWKCINGNASIFTNVNAIHSMAHSAEELKSESGRLLTRLFGVSCDESSFSGMLVGTITFGRDITACLLKSRNVVEDRASQLDCIM
jgi:hypothetical protein